ncbi:MAG: sugar ABC transporter permease [Clostridia bacterium]|nr:sugar ABC transporter permease [Clostridia bacterium]
MKNATLATPGGVAKRNTYWKRLTKNIWKNKVLYLFVLPALVWYVLFHYLPMGGLYVAFTRYKGVGDVFAAKYVGLKWFESFFKSKYASTTIINTLRLSLYALALFPLPIIVALMLNEIKQKKVKGVAQTIMYAPHFVSLVILISMIQLFFASKGIVNAAITALGGNAVNFMNSTKVYPHLYVWSGIWSSLGWNTIIYTAALSSVDPGLHEAATLDGASLLQRVRHINIPTIFPTIVITLILRVGSIMSLSTEKSLLLRNDVNMAVSETIGTFVYNRGLLGGDFGYAAAVGLFLNVVNLAMMLTVNFISKKVSETSLL